MENLNRQFEPCTLQTQQPLKPVNVLVTRELLWQPRMTLNPKHRIWRCNSMHFNISKKEYTKSYFEEAQELLLKQEMGVHWMPGTSPQTFAPLIHSPLLGNGCWLPESCCIQQTILLDMRPVVLGTYTCVSKTQHCLYLQSFQKMCNPRTQTLRQQMRHIPLTENLGQNLKHKILEEEIMQCNSEWNAGKSCGSNTIKWVRQRIFLEPVTALPTRLLGLYSMPGQHARLEETNPL
jgi:hypothetical protein